MKPGRVVSCAAPTMLAMIGMLAAALLVIGGGAGAISGTTKQFPNEMGRIATGGAWSTPAKAEMISPVPGSQLSGESVTFSWTAGIGVEGYALWVGSDPGSFETATDIADSGWLDSLSYAVEGLPAGCSIVYVELQSYIDTAWQANYYSYQAAGCPSPTPEPSPTPTATPAHTATPEPTETPEPETPTPTPTEVDLDAFLIERTPKLDYDAQPNMPQPGQAVTFYGHVRYWGDANSPVQSSVQYQWRIDGQIVQDGTISDFEPIRNTVFDYTGYPNPNDPSALKDPNNWPKNPAAFPNPPPTGWRVVKLQWNWQNGRHTVELVVDPNNAIAEKSEINNSLRDYTDALSFSGWVEETLWQHFHLYQDELGIGSNSWEDWIQRQMSKQNEMYEQAIWPDSPNGVLDRVRVDRIIVVPDGTLPVNGGIRSNNPDSSDKSIDLQWGFTPGELDPNTFYGDHNTTTIANPFYIQEALIHELGHARYLIDNYGFDVHNIAAHGGYDAVQIWEGGTYVGGSSYMPYLAWDEVLYYNTNGGVMGGPYGFAWSPYEAAALNLIAGQRARCGNMNSPCNLGEFLQDLPAFNHVLVVDQNGEPRRNADVRIFEAEGGQQPRYGKTFDNTPDQFYTTDDAGYLHLPRNPFNPGGEITHTGEMANGVIILRVQEGTQIWYRFMEAPDFNMEYWRGHTQDAYYTLTLPGPSPAASAWIHTCYIGAEQPIQQALAGAIGDVQAVYRLNSSQNFDRWFAGRPEVSNIQTVKPYEPLFVLMSKDAAWSQTPSGIPPTTVTLAQGWNSTCYLGQTMAAGDATGSIAAQLGMLYMLGSDQTWSRYVPGRPEVSNIAELTQYDAVLLLVNVEGGAQWVFNP